MPRARARAHARARLDIHLSVFSSFNLSYPSAVYSSSYPLDVRSQTRRVGDARTASPLVERMEAKGGLGE